jgi:hypothetical protein
MEDRKSNEASDDKQPGAGEYQFFRHSLGTKVRDKVTGFTGIVVCQSKWLFGCKRYTVQPLELKDGKRTETDCFDEDQLDPLDGGLVDSEESPGGGPMPEPKRPPNVRRQ